MNFFSAQDKARKRTAILVVLFLLAVAGLVVLTILLTAVLLSVGDGVQPGGGAWSIDRVTPKLAWQVGAAVILVIAGGSLIKMMALSGGGRAVAEMLGGQLVPADSRIPAHRKILNVVEEMAIASGVPVPPVYLLADDSINAFAAGTRIDNAVIGITRGAVNYLNRNELQGVIAHEFSHILNGDMRLNIRLTGVLHGILIIALTGEYLLRSTRHSHRSRGAGPVILLGLGLLVIGYIGHLFGNIIKAMVSRQREYLADASAVQFTRMPDGIANALKKIGGIESGSVLTAPAAPEYSHAYFAEGVSHFFEMLFATHPPLEKRIKVLEPSWDGRFPVPQPETGLSWQSEESKITEHDKRSSQAAVVMAGVSIAQALESVDSIGNPGERHLEYARALLEELPHGLVEAARNPAGARALVYLLIIHQERDVGRSQLEILEQKADPQVIEEIRQLLPLFGDLSRDMMLPLLELAMPALLQLSRQQFLVWREVIDALIQADGRVEYHEWVVRRLAVRPLEEQHGLYRQHGARIGSLKSVSTEVARLLSLAATLEHEDQKKAAEAFRHGARMAGLDNINMVPIAEMRLSSIDAAIERLEHLKPLQKPLLLKALVATLAWDGEVTSEGMALLRVLAANLDCPMPPVLPESA